MFESRESFDALADRLDTRNHQSEKVVPISRSQLAMWRRQADILDLFAEVQSLARPQAR